MYYGPDSTPLKVASKTRQVYLSAGCDWYDFWTGKRYKGGQRIEADAPLEIMPLFVKAGSILPMGPKVQHVHEALEAPIELRIYSGTDGTFDLYEDEGDSYRYECGAYAWTTISWDDQNKNLTFGDRKGSFEGLITEREYQVVLVREGHGVGLEIEARTDETSKYTGKTVSSKIIGANVAMHVII
jgi:alpha-D-xyloside xylohydrolase